MTARCAASVAPPEQTNDPVEDGNSEAPEAEGDTEVVEFLTFDTPAQPEVPNEAEATDEALMEFLLETDSDASPFDPDQDPLNESTAS